MYYDHIEAARKEAAKKKYEELKNHILSIDKDTDKVNVWFHSIDKDTDKVNVWFDAYRHMIGMESEIREQAEKIEKYEKFFGMLSTLLPKQSSIHDVIG